MKDNRVMSLIVDVYAAIAIAVILRVLIPQNDFYMMSCLVVGVLYVILKHRK